MRIISGSARGVSLASPEGFGTRPSSGRTKEAVFSSLQGEIPGAFVLDLFGGSGQMGLEAVSRGAEHAVICEKSDDSFMTIRENTIRTRFEEKTTLLKGDFREILDGMEGKNKFDLVFLDPPYSSGYIPVAMDLLDSRGLLNAGAIIVCEYADDDPASEGNNAYAIKKKYRYGKARIAVYIYDGR